MKSTGIVRNLDELGRITLPMELRRTMDIAPKDPVEISTEGDQIILKKYEDHKTCCKCGEVKKLIWDGGVGICKDCLMAFLDRLEE